MKNILITGANSYIGSSVERWLMKEPDKYKVETIDLKDGSWQEQDFSKYDVVFHVAGIVHIKETSANQNIYYEVNRDLTYEIAKKAKKEGVRQFIFLSTMSVYGIEKGVITKDSFLNPRTAYGKSKLEAERLINELKDENFKIVILRPPMVYGRNCKGNYSRLANLAIKTPVFPKIDNKRSMIYINNLSEFIKQVIDNESDGLFFPQNSEYVNTSEMVKLIAEVHGRRIIMVKLFNPILGVLNVNTINKVFGDLVYDKKMSENEIDYRIFEFEESIYKTEGIRE